MSRTRTSPASHRPPREPEGLLEVKTDFERQFNAEGIPTRHATWLRR